MGKGRHNRTVENYQQPTISTLHRLPTLSEIKVKLPAHCFRPTVRQSMSYVIKDIIYVVTTFLVMFQIEKHFQYGFLLFPVYWYVQGNEHFDEKNVLQYRFSRF